MHVDAGGFEQTFFHITVVHLFANMEVAEIYSPPRATDMAMNMGLRAGWAFDFTVADNDACAWDFI